MQQNLAAYLTFLSITPADRYHDDHQRSRDYDALTASTVASVR